MLSRSGSEHVLLSAIWITTVALLGLSLLALCLVVLRRWRLDRAAIQRETTTKRIQGYFYATLKSPRMPTRESLPKIQAADYPTIMHVGLDILRTITGTDRKRILMLFELWDLTSYICETACSGPPGRRIQALTILGDLTDRDSLDILMQSLSSPDLHVQMTAVHALARRDTGKRTKEIFIRLAEASYTSPILLADALSRYGPGAAQRIRQLATVSASCSIRLGAIRALALLRDADSGNILAHLLNDSQPDIRIAAIAALARIGDLRSHAAIAARLSDPDHRVRDAAARAAGELRLGSALPALIHALEDPVWLVRFHAAEAITKFGPRGMAILQTRVRSNEGEGANIARQIIAQIGEAA